jgi:DNA-binding NtrC family response regulator
VTLRFKPVTNHRQYDNESRPSLRALPDTAHRILVVEDAPELRASLERLLIRQGFRPTVASDSEQALELVKANTFDLLLTDLTLPGMNGLELRDHVSRIEPGLRVLFMSGFGDDTVAPRLQGPTEQKLLRKPFTAQELYEAIAATLGHSSPSADDA